MKTKRFDGDAGKAALALLFAEQSLLFGVPDALAAALAEVARVEEFAANAPIYHEGEKVRPVIWFVLGGSVLIGKGLKPLATLGRRQFFGEFPVLDATAPYTVSVTAIERTFVALVPAGRFDELAAQYPRVWRNMAAELASRLRGPSVPLDWKAMGYAEMAKVFVKRVLDGLFPDARRLQFVFCLIYASILLVAAAVYFWTKLPEATRCGLFPKPAVAAAAPSSAAIATPAASASSVR